MYSRLQYPSTLWKTYLQKKIPKNYIVPPVFFFFSSKCLTTNIFLVSCKKIVVTNKFPHLFSPLFFLEFCFNRLLFLSSPFLFEKEKYLPFFAIKKNTSRIEPLMALLISFKISWLFCSLNKNWIAMVKNSFLLFWGKTKFLSNQETTFKGKIFSKRQSK